MISASVFRAIARIASAALAGAALVIAAYAFRPGFTLEMDRPMAANLIGFHGPERVGRETFAWTGREVTMRLPGLDRRGTWECTIRLRGGRQDLSTLPEAVITVDGIVAARHRTSNDFSDLVVRLPPSTSEGAVISLIVDNTFRPGGGDKRELGAYVDRWACHPADFLPLPPAATLRWASVATAAFAALLTLMGSSLLWFALGIVALAALQGAPLTHGLAPFASFATPLPWVAIAVAGATALLFATATRVLSRPMSVEGRAALFLTAAVLYLKLLMLFHPAKPNIDIVFHAHRLQWVLDGQYYFTQQMPSGVVFPYAIGLYVFAIPWTIFTSDFESLLRVIVTSAEAAGGLLIFVLIAKCWNDRAVALVATALYALVPRTFEIVGNANMTNAFGQSVALAVLVAATLWTLTWRRWAIFTALLAFALLCHISTLTLLGTIVAMLTALYWFAAGRELRSHAWALAASLLVAATFAVVVYYAHFGDAYRSAARIRAAPAAATSEANTAAAVLPKKISDAARLSVEAVGWPIALLALPGVAAWKRRGWRDRLGLAIAALALTFGLFTLTVVAAPVNQSFQRYAAEFISRVTLATYPAMIILAALGAVWAWRAGALARLAAVALLAAAFATGVNAAMAWLQ